MMKTVLSIASLVVISAAIIVSGESGPITEPIPLLLWAASDPAEDQEVSKINTVKFFHFLESYRTELAEYYNASDIIGASLFLSSHSQESGTEGTLWAAVFAKIAYKKAIGETEEKEHGVPSLIAWAVRNTGPETQYSTVDRATLIEFILYHKTPILKLLYQGNVDGLILYFDETKSESSSKAIDWKTVITELKDNRQLFKYSCGLFGLQLCDRLK